jgi:hypothetical protein
MVLGMVAAVVGKVTSQWEIALFALIALVGGGGVVARALRSQTVYGERPLRLPLLPVVSGLRRRPPRRRRIVLDPGLSAYARQLDDALSACEMLVADLPPNEERISAARDRLMSLIASPKYGVALEKRLVDERRVRQISSALARLS